VEADDVTLTPLQVEVLTYLAQRPNLETVPLWRLLIDVSDGPVERRKDGGVARRRLWPVIASLERDEFLVHFGISDCVAITKLGREALSEFAFGES
jgi:hypothetical protein